MQLNPLSLRAAVAVACLMTAAASAQAQTCTNGGGQGGRVKLGAEGFVPPWELGGGLLCNGQSLTSTLLAPASYDTRLLHFQLEGQASGRDGIVHARAKSQVLDGLLPPADRALPYGAFAEAGAVVNFTLSARPGTPASARARVTIDGTGDGLLGGQGRKTDQASAELRLRSDNPYFGIVSGWSSDSEGGVTDVFPGSFSSTGAERLVQYGFEGVGFFAPGSHWIQLDLAVWATGNAHVDFGNTSRITGFNLEGEEFDLSLPPGLFTADPNQPGHYILSSLLPVPEPASAGLWLAGLLGLAWRRRGVDAARSCS
nr:PEP-CTERM sorting domain-containing protein [uncultured Roseateles sp.]